MEKKWRINRFKAAMSSMHFFELVSSFCLFTLKNLINAERSKLKIAVAINSISFLLERWLIPLIIETKSRSFLPFDVAVNCIQVDDVSRLTTNATWTSIFVQQSILKALKRRWVKLVLLKCKWICAEKMLINNLLWLCHLWRRVSRSRVNFWIQIQLRWLKS